MTGRSGASWRRIPRPGAAQLVEIRETVQEIVVPVYVQARVVAEAAAAAKKPLFADMSDDELLGYGVPAEWLDDVKQATEDTLLALTDHLPAEAAEALLELATGGKPRVPQPAVAAANPFEHPDAQRRFRVMANVEELERALDFPWEKWTVFLHPEQRQWVERDYAGPARVSGSAGTGKTIVALHRAVYLARSEPRRPSPADDLLRHAGECAADQAEATVEQRAASGRTDRCSLAQCDRPAALQGARRAGDDRQPRSSPRAVERGRGAVDGHKFSLHFLLTEWEQVVDAWQLENWEAYRDVARLGRRRGFRSRSARCLWSIFERVRAGLKARKLITHARAVHAHWPPRSRKSKKPRLRLRGRGRSAGYQRRPPAVLCRAWAEVAPTLCSSRATSVSASSSSPSPGRRSAWIFAAARAPCASTTALRIRSACRRTGCSGRR